MGSCRKGQAPLETIGQHLKRKVSLTGQAILELAIFGSMLIMLLGVLISYGLRYNAQQKITQETYRKAMAAAAVSGPDYSGTSTSTSYSLTKDIHIPNPSDPFGVGQVLPVSASASVTRGYELDATADTEDELPQMVMNIQGQEFKISGHQPRTAGFREEFNVPTESLDKYEEIYGSSNVWETGDGVCLNEDEDIINPITGELIPCTSTSKNIKIIDSFAGEIFSYGIAVRNCRQIVDEDACIKECERGATTNCSEVCAQTMNVPWYCGNNSDVDTSNDYTEIDTVNHRYNFPVLNTLFASAPGTQRSLGLQSDFTQVTSINNKLERTETKADISATDTLDWQVDTNRTVVYKPYGTTDTVTNTQGISTSISQDKTQNWNVAQ